MDAVITTGGVVQELSRRHPGKALAFFLFGLAFAAIAVSVLRLSVTWAAADIRRLLATGPRTTPFEASIVTPLGTLFLRYSSCRWRVAR